MWPNNREPTPQNPEEEQVLRLLSALAPQERRAFTREELRWRHLRRRWWQRDENGVRLLGR
jgi:hypothetical protein